MRKSHRHVNQVLAVKETARAVQGIQKRKLSLINEITMPKKCRTLLLFSISAILIQVSGVYEYTWYKLCHGHHLPYSEKGESAFS